MDTSSKSDDNVEADSFSVPPQNQNEEEFHSSKLNFEDDVNDSQLKELGSVTEKSKIGLEDSRALSDINKMYDVLHSEK